MPARITDQQRRLLGIAVDARAARALGAGSGGATPCIVKLISSGKSARSASRMISYVARLDRVPVRDEEESEAAFLERSDDAKRRALRHEDDGDDTPVVYDEQGAFIPRDEVLQHLAGWTLLPDQANQSKKARALKERGGDPYELDVASRLFRVQARHFVLSVPCDRPLDRYRMEQAAAETVRETFGAWGHRCLWAGHYEHGGHAHVHVVVKNYTDDVPQRALRLTRSEPLIDALRFVFARELEKQGFAPVESSRAADRPERIDDMAAPGRLSRTQPRDVYEMRRGTLHAGDALRLAVPDLRQLFVDADAAGAAMATRHEPMRGVRSGRAWRDSIRQLVRGRAVASNDEDGGGYELVTGLVDCTAATLDVEQRHRRGAQAYHRFQALASRNMPLAQWYLEQRPEIFGLVRRPGPELYRSLCASAEILLGMTSDGPATPQIRSEDLQRPPAEGGRHRRSRQAAGDSGGGVAQPPLVSPERAAREMEKLAGLTERLAMEGDGRLERAGLLRQRAVELRIGGDDRLRSPAAGRPGTGGRDAGEGNPRRPPRRPSRDDGIDR